MGVEYDAVNHNSCDGWYRFRALPQNGWNKFPQGPVGNVLRGVVIGDDEIGHGRSFS